jgi:hypothetical protein
MRLGPSLLTCVLLSAFISSVGCMEPRYPDEFDETSQAAWNADAAVISSITAPDAGVGQMPPSGFLPGQPSAPQGANDAGRIDMTPPRVPDAGTTIPVTRPDAGGVRDAGSTTPVVDTGTPSEVDAGGEQPPASGAVTSCSISASTNADDAFFYNGKYGCGVWIANSAGKAVKVFMVATRIANRSGLSAYRTATSGVMVDVTASATLQSAKQHQYTWDLKDMSGAAVPSGSYKLVVETHSSSGDAVVSVPFDTSKGPVSETGSPMIDVRSASINCD